MAGLSSRGKNVFIEIYRYHLLDHQRLIKKTWRNFKTASYECQEPEVLYKSLKEIKVPPWNNNPPMVWQPISEWLSNFANSEIMYDHQYWETFTCRFRRFNKLPNHKISDSHELSPSPPASSSSLGHGDGTSYKNNFDFHSYSSGNRFRDEGYLFFNQFSSWFEGNFWSYF